MQSAPPLYPDTDLHDAALVIAFRDGDTAAFDVLFERYHPGLVRFLTVRLRDAAAAEDVAQETMIRAMRAIDTFDCTRPLRPWLRRIASNAAVDMMRARGRAAALSTALEQQPSAHETAADLAMGDIGEIDLLRRALGEVPDRQRQALVRCYVEGYRPSEAAADFGVGSNAFEQLLHRARANLRRAYLRHDGEDRAAGLLPLLLAVIASAQRRVLRLCHTDQLLPSVGQVMASGVVAASLTLGAGLAPSPAVEPELAERAPITTPAQPVQVPTRAVPAPVAPAAQVPVPAPVGSGDLTAPAGATQRPAPVALEPRAAEPAADPDASGLPTGMGEQDSSHIDGPVVPGGAPLQPDDRPPAAGPAAAADPDEGVAEAMGGCGSVVRGAVCAVDTEAGAAVAGLS